MQCRLEPLQGPRRTAIDLWSLLVMLSGSSTAIPKVLLAVTVSCTPPAKQNWAASHYSCCLSILGMALPRSCLRT